MVNGMSLNETVRESEETLRHDMKSLFDQFESKPSDEASAKILLVDNNIFFALHILN